MTYTVRFTSDSKKDFETLDGSEKIQIRKSIAKIEKHGMNIGLPLRGDLSGCNKLVHKRAGLRVVFREEANGIEIIDIVAIGKRSDLEVYKMAEERLK